MPVKQRKIRIEGNAAYVPLSQGHEAVIDIDDVPLVEGFLWHAKVRKTTVYAVRTDRSGGRVARLLLHRALMCAANGIEVDHIDGDGLNNRRGNLRLATPSQNKRNRRVNRNNTSGFKGVSFHKTSQKWQARIMVDSKMILLGYHDTPESAYAAYCDASERLHGEFGRAR